MNRFYSSNVLQSSFDHMNSGCAYCLHKQMRDWSEIAMSAFKTYHANIYLHRKCCLHITSAADIQMHSKLILSCKQTNYEP